MKRHAVLALVFAQAICACQAEDLGPTGGTSAVTGGTGAPSGGAGGTGATGGTGTTGGQGGEAGTFNSVSGEGGGGAGGEGGTGGGAEPMCANQGEINFDCPFNLPPISGTCAPHGVCCHRASNAAKIAALGPDDPAVFEYRLNYVDIINHPFSIGLPDLQRTANQRADVCAGEQCLLWRFTQPRQGGALVAGMGEAEIGVGAYNCDGSFSFYGPNAAPDRSAEIGESEPGRWQAVKVPAEYDPSKEGIESFRIPWVTNKNRQTARSIFLFPSDNTIDWELASSGFEITDIDTTEAGWDCMGTREGFGWGTRAGFVAYSPMKGNDKDISNQISQTYCALLGFGLLPEGAKDKDCLTTARCLPDGGIFGDGGCDWVKLPDSLCPESAEQQAIFGCHLGAEGNPNEETDYPATLNCTPEEPTAALDPDMGATSLGQCCDPLGASTTLPACNAYRTVGKFVAAAAEITDAPRANLPPVCE